MATTVRRPRRLAVILSLLLAMVMLTACSSSGSSKFVGEWVDIKRGDVATVTRNGDNFIWKDSEGSYPAVYQDGMLRIEVGLGQVVMSYDEKTGHLIGSFLGSTYEFERRK